MQVKGYCKKCNQYKNIFAKNMCQVCYLKDIDGFQYYTYIPNVIIKNAKHKKICECYVKYNMATKEIAKKFSMNTQVINAIKRRYLVRCDTFGNIKKD